MYLPTPLVVVVDPRDKCPHARVDPRVPLTSTPISPANQSNQFLCTVDEGSSRIAGASVFAALLFSGANHGVGNRLQAVVLRTARGAIDIGNPDLEQIGRQGPAALAGVSPAGHSDLEAGDRVPALRGKFGEGGDAGHGRG